MRDASTVVHHEHVSTRSFEAVIAAFETAVGSVENGGLQKEVAAARDRPDFEARIVSAIARES